MSSYKVEAKSYPYTDLDWPLGLQKIEAPRISTQLAREGSKVLIPTHRPSLPPGVISGTHICHSLSTLQGHSVAGRLKSMKK